MPEKMALNDIDWQGKKIDVGDWGNDNSGFMVDVKIIKWDGTARSMNELLIRHLDGLPEKNLVGWPKTTIESIRLSGNLSEDGEQKDLAIFCMRSYGETEQPTGVARQGSSFTIKISSS